MYLDFDFLKPVNDLLVAHNELLSPQALGNQIAIHTAQQGIPDSIDTAKFAIIAVLENQGKNQAQRQQQVAGARQ